jgi:C4-type Zn-finger protein
MLGAIRQKYSTIPIPGGEVTLDGAELRSEASTEKEALLTQLREMLEASLPSKLIEEQAMKADKSTEILKKVPMMIYIG